MVTIVGVRFKRAGKIYYFIPGDYALTIGDHVIVETARGIEYGTVVLGPREMEESQVVHPLKNVVRKATEADDQKAAENRQKEKKPMPFARKNCRQEATHASGQCGIYV